MNLSVVDIGHNESSLLAPPKYRVRAVAQAANLLRVIGAAPAPGLGVPAMMDKVNGKMHTTHHYVRTLTYEGFLQRWEPWSYTLGLSILDLAWDASTQLIEINKDKSVSVMADETGRPRRDLLPYLAVARDIAQYPRPGRRER